MVLARQIIKLHVDKHVVGFKNPSSLKTLSDAQLTDAANLVMRYYPGFVS